ncbi:MAG: RNA polymerase sigma factor [Planctomycetota bacterium]|nr:RNA polymerase sigma factor [Planctomycetota bacterium]
MSGATGKTPESPQVRPSEPSDEELLLRYRDSGEQQAFDHLVKRFEAELYNYLRRYLGNAAMAEDVFQASFLQVHLKSHLFEEGRRFKPWLYTIATNQAIDAIRRSGKHRAVSLDSQGPEDSDVGTLVNILSDGELGPQEEMEVRERRDWVRESVDELAEPLRGVVLLVFFQGLKYRDAAEILDIPVGTVKSRLHSALIKLGGALKRRPIDTGEDE